MKLSEILKDVLPEGRFWTHSRTLVDGCTKVSPGCLNCWSESLAKRFGNHVGVYSNGWNGQVIEHPERMADILPKSALRKPRVWTYWNDLFHEGVSDKFRNEFFKLSGVGWDYHIICTKRPHEVVSYFERRSRPGSKTIFLVTMENQDMVQKRWKAAAKMEALGLKTGLLIEPMLSRIDIDPSWLDLMSWIICGPENGKGKRPFDPQWAMRLQAQAKAAGVPFFYKAGLLNGKQYLETP
jgi:protein gp37